MLTHREFILNQKCDLVIGEQASTVICVQHDDYLQLNLTAIPEKLNKVLMEKLKWIFEILLGKVCQTTMFRLMEHEQETIEIYSFDKNLPNRQLAEPIRSQSIVNFENFEKCITNILSYDGSFNIVYGYWHKVNRAYQGSIENAALALTVSIEGILKEFYQDFGQPTEVDLSLFNAGKEVVKNLETEQIIKDRLMSSLANMNNFSSRKVLKHLSSMDLVTNKTITDWQSFRNKSAHADRVGAQDDFQHYLDSFIVA